MNFEQALPHLRRGFIMRISGADGFEGAQLRANGAKLELGFGDGQWQDAGHVPVLDLSFDVYDQQKVEPVDYTKPLVERDPGAKVLTQELADAKAGAELGATSSQPTAEDEEELELEALRILEENGERSPTDEQVADLVAQLKAKAAQLDPVVQTGGNTPEPPPSDGVQSPTQGLNEAQTDQVEPPGPDEAEDDIPDEPTKVAEPR